MPNAIDERPELAAAVGRMCGHWSYAEFYLAMVFGDLSGLDQTMAVVIFSKFRSVSNQCGVLQSVAKASTRCDPAMLKALEDVLAKYQMLAPRRNEIAHNPFGWSSEKGLYRMGREKVSKPKVFPYRSVPITPEEIDACLMTFAAEQAKKEPPAGGATPFRRRGMDRNHAGRLTGRVRVGSPSSFPAGLNGYQGESPG